MKCKTDISLISGKDTQPCGDSRRFLDFGVYGCKSLTTPGLLSELCTDKRVGQSYTVECKPPLVELKPAVYSLMCTETGWTDKLGPCYCRSKHVCGIHRYETPSPATAVGRNCKRACKSEGLWSSGSDLIQCGPDG